MYALSFFGKKRGVRTKLTPCEYEEDEDVPYAGKGNGKSGNNYSRKVKGRIGNNYGKGSDGRHGGNKDGWNRNEKQ